MIFFPKAIWLTYLFCLLISITLSGQNRDLDLHTERGNVSTDGRIKLIWGSAGDEVEYELQSSTNADFRQSRTIYKGPDRASFVSGLNDGTYHYRVRASGGPWSEELMVEVRHHSLRLAMILFVVGGIVFVLTVGVVVEGTMRTKKVTA